MYSGPSRVDQRHAHQLDIRLHLGKKKVPLVTEDVSFSGLFIRTDRAPGESSLVRIEVPLDDDPDPIVLTAVVKHVIPPDNDGGRVPGFGVQLYGVAGSHRDRWNRYVAGVQQQGEDSYDSIRVFYDADSTIPEPIRRQYPRFRARLRAVVNHVDQLISFYTQDISRGGGFLVYAKGKRIEAEVDQTLLLELDHPDNERTFAVRCTVKRVASDGIGVAFDDLADDQRDEFWDFIEPAIELDVGDIEFA